jgi:3-oxoacyl-[acyl-carrier-protein] synthase-3
MNSGISARILAFGTAFPEQILTNQDLEKTVDTSDQWIIERTGIHSRRKLRDGENNSDIGCKAATVAIARAGIKAEDIDLIIGCTNTPDRWMPSLAATIQGKLGIVNGSAAYDINTACAGWMAGLQVADAFIKTENYKCVLVLGSEALSRFVNWQDRTTCVLFGDGAGASIVVPGKPGDRGEILDVRVHSDGRYGDALCLPGCGSATPASSEVLDKKAQYIFMNGQEIFKHAVRNMASVCEEVLQRKGFKTSDVDWLVPHQANSRIIEAVAKKLEFPIDKVAFNVQHYGNTSAATIPTCFDEYVQSGQIRPGQLVLMTTFGGGLTWAGGLIRW